MTPVSDRAAFERERLVSIIIDKGMMRRDVACDVADAIFIHVTPICEHDFQGWREHSDGRGGEQVCSKCGLGAMTWSLRTGI